MKDYRSTAPGSICEHICMNNSTVQDSRELSSRNIAALYGWPPGGTWLGQVTFVHAPGRWGFITVFDDDGNVLVDPASKPVDYAWFSPRINLAQGDWVIFQLESASSEKKEQRKNPHLVQVIERSVVRVRDITAITKHLKAESPIAINELRDDYPEGLILLGERILMVDAFAHDIEARIQAEYERQQVEARSKLEQEYAEKQNILDRAQGELEQERSKQREAEQKIVARYEVLKKDVATFEGDQERFRTEQQQELERIEQRRNQLATIEAQHQERLRRWGLLIESQSDKAHQYATFTNEGELIDRVLDYMAAHNYMYDRHDLVNFYTCLKTGAIVVLAGLSGTGKSSLVRLFAQAIDAEFRLVPVKATWNDDTDLLGFFHPDKRRYYSTPFLDTLVEANANPNRLFFICLDEMNLARVEYYLSDFLSVLEQGEERKLSLYSRHEWELCKVDLEQYQRALADGAISHEEWQRRERSILAYSADLRIPHNIFFCGTVNIDETTHPFSDKVLDRSQIIQFTDAPFRDLQDRSHAALPVQLRFSQWETFCQPAGGSQLSSSWFNDINGYLRVGGFHFGHRVKRHIEDYCRFAHSSGLFNGLHEDAIVDLQIVQKILPKIRGIRTDKVERMFTQLNQFCSSRYPQASNRLRIMETMDPINYWQVFHD